MRSNLIFHLWKKAKFINFGLLIRKFTFLETSPLKGILKSRFCHLFKKFHFPSIAIGFCIGFSTNAYHHICCLVSNLNTPITFWSTFRTFPAKLSIIATFLCTNFSIFQK